MCRHIYIHTHKYTCICTYTNIHTYTYIHTCAFRHIHTETHIDTHTYMYNNILYFQLFFKLGSQGETFFCVRHKTPRIKIRIYTHYLSILCLVSWSLLEINQQNFFKTSVLKTLILLVSTRCLPVCLKWEWFLFVHWFLKHRYCN